MASVSIFTKVIKCSNPLLFFHHFKYLGEIFLQKYLYIHIYQNVLDKAIIDSFNF